MISKSPFPFIPWILKVNLLKMRLVILSYHIGTKIKFKKWMNRGISKHRPFALLVWQKTSHLQEMSRANITTPKVCSRIVTNGAKTIGVHHWTNYPPFRRKHQAPKNFRRWRNQVARLPLVSGHHKQRSLPAKNNKSKESLQDSLLVHLRTNMVSQTLSPMLIHDHRHLLISKISHHQIR